MPIQELNPNNEAMQLIRENWPKVCMMLMHRFGVSEFTVTEEDMQWLGNNQRAIAVDARGGLTFRLVTMQEAEALARKVGGLAQ